MRPFASQLNFLDPQKTEDGQPYSPIRYKELVKECYLISKNLNTSYLDVLKITPLERNYLIKFLVEEAKYNKDMIEQSRAKNKRNK